MGKLGVFLAGMTVGAIGLGVTACLVDKFSTSPNSNCDYDDDEDNIAKSNITEDSPYILSDKPRKFGDEPLDETTVYKANTEQEESTPSSNNVQTLGKIIEAVADVLANTETKTEQPNMQANA